MRTTTPRGFQQAGAKAVFAIGLEHPDYVLRGLFRSNLTMRQIFWNTPGGHPARQGRATTRSGPAGARILDPRNNRYYFRSVVGDLDMRASRWR